MHIPVFTKEVLELLNPQPNENFIDCTLGEAGHSLEILKRTAPFGKLIGIDLNNDSLKIARKKIEEAGIKEERLIFANKNFADLKNIVEENKFGPVNGILFDLGISSSELEESGRGFSFQKNEPLLMTFEIEPSFEDLTAEKIVNGRREDELVIIFKEYGEERFARKIAAKIVEARRKKRIKTTGELVEIISTAIPLRFRRGKTHFATRIFQALRIAVNDELENLKKGLVGALDILSPSGRIAVISFHSLEDRIVKNFFRDQAKNNLLKILTKKPLKPEHEEILNNSRSRSAILRAASRL